MAALAPAPRQARGAAIRSAAIAVPRAVVANASIAERFGVDDRWIRKRTGVVERRIARDGETVASLAAEAATEALRSAGCAPELVDLVLVATMTQDQITPNVASTVIGRLDGLPCAGALDVNAACTGWIGAVGMAAAQLETGRAEHVLVIGADLLSRITNPDDRATACLFGDGAGAVLMSAVDGPTRVGPVVLGTDASGGTLIWGEHREGFLRMRGGETFEAAVARLAEGSGAAAAAAGVALADVGLFVFHQANGRILSAVAQRMGLAEERLMVSVDRYGNTSAASIPMALAEASREGRLEAGMPVLLSAFGSGFTWAATVVEWG
jgi:3-oxoacyl-[acyl-carrier-protein] synthase III